MRVVLSLILLFAGFSANAEQWELAGESSAGKHYVDHASVVRAPVGHLFSAQTKVEQADASVWITTLQVDCKTHCFSYLKGVQLKNGKQVVRFDAPRAEEAISPGSLPDLLQQRYCEQAPHAVRPTQWEVVSNSNTGEVALDRASLHASSSGADSSQVFTVNTRVKPFNKNEQTLSTLQFDCVQQTFRVLQAQRVRDGKTESLFDTPQPSAPVSKSATTQHLAKAVCSPSPKQARNPFQEDACKVALNELQALEGKVQADVDANALYCDAMQQYLDQLSRIAETVEKNHCAIHRLDEYQRQIRAAGCEEPMNEH